MSGTRSDGSVDVQRREFKPYPVYKNSGVEWLGTIPRHWEMRRLRMTLTSCQNGVWGEEPDGLRDLLCVRVADFDRVTFSVNIRHPTLRSIDEAVAKTRCLRAGDLLLEKSGGGENQPVGAVVIYNHEMPAVCSNFVARMTIAEGYDSRFLTYLHAALYASRINTRHIKQSTGIQNLDSASYLNEATGFPDIVEQHAIAAFLDRETARIDALVARKERLIELLREKRTALITHAVTNGLDPDVLMKDSGVEWLGHIPAHWDVTPNMRLFEQRDERGRDDLPILEVSIASGVRLREFSDTKIEQRSDDLGSYKIARFGDIAFNKMRMWQGAVGVTPEDGLVSPDYIIARPRPRVDSYFYESVFRTPIYMAEVYRWSHGIVDDRNRLYWDDFKSICAPNPPLDEQHAIVTFLDGETGRIAALIAKIHDAIDRLKELRTALISAAVTGKIDVRQEAA